MCQKHTVLVPGSFLLFADEVKLVRDAYYVESSCNFVIIVEDDCEFAICEVKITGQIAYHFANTEVKGSEDLYCHTSSHLDVYGTELEPRFRF